MMWGAFVFSVALIIGCSYLFPALFRTIASIQQGTPDYRITSGTATAYTITKCLWGIAALSWLLILRPNQLLHAIAINALIAIAILGLVVLSALTQVLTVLPMP